MFIQVALLSQPYGVYTYLPSPHFPKSFWQAGLRVIVPFGRSRNIYRLGVVVDLLAENNLPSSVKLRTVFWPVELKPLLKADLLHLIFDLERRQGVSAGKIAEAFLPAAFKSTNLVLHNIDLNGAKIYSLIDLATLSDAERQNLADSLLAGQAKILPGPRSAADEEAYSINCEPPWPVRPGAKIQLAILEYLQTNGTTSRKILAKEVGGSLAQALQALLKNGHILLGRGDVAVEEENRALLPPAGRPFSLNADQMKCVDELSAAMDEHKFKATLLYGITGSGKTAVYLEIAARMLKKKRSVLLLVPEVALALKLIQDAKTIYPEIETRLFHGYQTASYRENLWREVANEPVSLIVGTRSALFLPVENLGWTTTCRSHKKIV
ncbi:MAG: DEAD/DEAH box helicase family protein [Desulfovibrionaceae bacterium]|nr:DEAD/DEAH box helicase family protein [Desulfovibrionaceae bacterium]